MKNDRIDLLTKREKQVFQLVGKGISTKEIAVKLKLSFHTVNTHRKNIWKKLGVKSLGELILTASRYKGGKA